MFPSAGASTLRRPDDSSTALFVTFTPKDLPAGVVAFRDLSLFVQGLQRISDGMVQADYERSDADVLLGAFRFVVLAETPGSFRLMIALRPIVVVIEQVFGPDRLRGASPDQMTSLYDSAAAVIGAENVDVVARRAVSHQRNLLAFMRDIRAQNLAEHRHRLERKETQRGFKDLLEVIKDPSRLTTSLSESPDGLDPIVVDRRSIENAMQPLTQIVAGPYVQARGAVNLWSNRERRVDLDIVGFSSSVRCVYPNALAATMLGVLSPTGVIIVRGFSYYPIGAAQVPPPHHIDVREVLAGSDPAAPATLEPDYQEWPEPANWLPNGLPRFAS